MEEIISFQEIKMKMGTLSGVLKPMETGYQQVITHIGTQFRTNSHFSATDGILSQ